LREELKKVTNKEVQINISEIKRPEVDTPVWSLRILHNNWKHVFPSDER